MSRLPAEDHNNNSQSFPAALAQILPTFSFSVSSPPSPALPLSKTPLNCTAKRWSDYTLPPIATGWLRPDSRDERSSLLAAFDPLQSDDSRPMTASSAETARSIPPPISPVGPARAGKMPLARAVAMEEDFDSLPPAVRRKYFSTLERLRLAEGSSLPNRHRVGSHSRKSSTLSTFSINNLHIERRASTRNPAPQLRRQRRPHTRQNSISQEDAQFYLGLPDKIRKIYFTREEQVLFANRYETVILDAADEAFYKLGRQRNRSLQEDLCSESSFFMASSRHLKRGSADMSSSIHDSFLWMDGKDDLDQRLKLDDYHSHLSPESSVPISPTTSDFKRTSFRRRTMSLSSSKFARVSTSSSMHTPPPLPTPTRLNRPSYTHSRKGSKSFTSVAVHRNATRTSISTIDPEATYYQDPEARLKLRVYLASPQKFDEAIEFGFPSTDTTPTECGKAPRLLHPSNLESAAEADIEESEIETPLEDDGTFLDDGDDSSITDNDSPKTPSDADGSFRATHRLPSSKPSSTDSSGPTQSPTRSPMSRHGHSGSYVQALPANREMTLRMTLTRSDLRADESQLYGWQGKPKEDALALEELPELTEETSPSTGPFGGSDGWSIPKEHGVVKRFWRRVKLTGAKR